MAWGIFNISGAVYDTKSITVSSQDLYPYSVLFNDDGTKMYVVGGQNKRIYQYTLSTAWDVSTASYASKSFLFTGQDSSGVKGVYFKPDGTVMYATGLGDNRVYQYTLSTAWDVSTASYASKNFSVSSQISSIETLFFNDDGTKMYVNDFASKRIYQYTLSTAWDVSTASYASKSFLYSSQANSNAGIYINPDGDKLYIIGFTGKRVYQYTLSTAWDISTASYDSDSFSVNSQETEPNGVWFKEDNGTKMYVTGYSAKVYQYTTHTPLTGTSKFFQLF